MHKPTSNIPISSQDLHEFYVAYLRAADEVKSSEHNLPCTMSFGLCMALARFNEGKPLAVGALPEVGSYNSDLHIEMKHQFYAAGVEDPTYPFGMKVHGPVPVRIKWCEDRVRDYMDVNGELDG